MRFLLVLLAFCLVSCAYTGTHFKSDYDVSQIEQAREGLLIINTVGILKMKNGDLATKKIRAVAFPIGDGYILALKHCVKMEDGLLVRSAFGVLRIPAKLIKQDTFVREEKLELIGMKDDICLLRSKKLLEAYPFPFGDSDKVRVGDKVLSVGFSFAKDFNVKDGVISTLNANSDYFRADDDSGKPTDMFMHSSPVNGGDSGSPLFAIRNGKLEIIGLTNAMLRGNGMGFALKSNYVLKTVEQIKNAKK